MHINRPTKLVGGGDILNQYSLLYQCLQVHRRVSLFLTLQEFTISSGRGFGGVGGCHGNGSRGGNGGQTLRDPRAIHGLPLISPQTSETTRSSHSLGHLSHVGQLILHIWALRLRRSVSQIRILKAFAFQLLVHPTYRKTVRHENNRVRTGLFKQKKMIQCF